MTSTASESSRPSTSWADKPIDWDPLRLHPPMSNARSPNVHPSRSPRQIHFEDDAGRPAPPNRRRARSLRELQASSSPYVEVYDGFDFGFENHNSKPAQSSSDSASHDAQAPAGPAPARSNGQGALVMPRPHPSDMNSVEHFLKRGDWKRRGIVFASQEVSLASEDEPF